MSTIINLATAHHDRTPAPTPPVEVEIVWVDPFDVEFGDNVRTEASVGAEFVSSVAAHGFFQVPSSFRRADGAIQILDGQRRILAARAAGLPQVPVLVRPAPDGDDAARTLTRITHQYSANEHREALTTTQKLVAVEQVLNLPGVGEARAAKALAIPRRQVAAAAKVAKSTIRDHAAGNELTLDQLAIMVEFEDWPEDVETLCDAAASGQQLDHTAARLRLARETRAARAAAVQHWTERGFSVVDDRADIRTALPMHRLDDAEHNPVTPDAITEPEHWSVWLDEDDNDGRTVWVPRFYCHDLSGAGVVDRWTHHNGRKPDPDDEAAKEAKRAERRIVRTCNDAARAAATVRRKHVAAVLARKTAPKSAAAFVARMLSTHHDLLGEHEADSTACELLGIKSNKAVTDTITTASDARAQVITLGYVLGALENRVKPDAWRSKPAGVSEYLEWLHDATGYELSHVDEVVTGERTPDQVARIK